MLLKRKTLFVSIGSILLLFVIAGCLLSSAAQQTGIIPPEGSGDGGSGASNANVRPVSNNPGDRPPAPTNLRGDHIAIFDVLVEWDDKSTNEDGFRIYRRRMDQLTPLWIAGEVAADLTAFQDADTLCGATYQYIVASFNEVGESPATACWQITLPPCTTEQTVDLTFGAANGYNFVNRQAGPAADFYLDFDDSGQAEFRADGDGQNGLINLGALGYWPLAQVDLPHDVIYNRDGIPARPGDTYAALTRDGSSVVVFQLDDLGSTATLRALVWFDIDLIDPGVCEPFTLADYPGGGPCISGDDVCNPDCFMPPADRIGETGDVEDLLGSIDWENEEVERVGPVGWGPGANPDAQENCAENARHRLGEEPTPEDIAEADAYFVACLEDAGYVRVRDGGGGDHPDAAMFRDPTLTEVDYDCEGACVPEDGLCVESCGYMRISVPVDYRFEAETDIDGDGWPEARYIWAGVGEPPYGPYWYVDLNDVDCYPGELPPPIYICIGPHQALQLREDYELMDSADRDGDGEDDIFAYGNLNPESPEYRQVMIVDLLCYEPTETYICSVERPAELTSDYDELDSRDTNGDDVYDLFYLTNGSGNIIIWDTLCGGPTEQTFCTTERPAALTPDYTQIHETDRDGDGEPDLMVFAIMEPTNPQYGSRIIWDTLCDPGQRALYYCGVDEPPWQPPDWEMLSATPTHRTYRNTNPDSPDYGMVGIWDFGPNCVPAQPNTETVVEEVWYCEYLGRGRYQWYTVARTFVDGVAVSEEIVSGPHTGGWQPNCPAGQDPEEPPDDEPPPDEEVCECRYMCVRFSSGTTTHIECLEYGYRDCHGDSCDPNN